MQLVARKNFYSVCYLNVATFAALSLSVYAFIPNVAHADQVDTVPAKADTTPAKALTVGGNVTVVSDYLMRGITQTQRKPTVQAEIDLTHTSGWYGTIFGSGVSNAAYPNGSGSEIDLITGWQFSLPADIGLNLGYYAYFYPGAHTVDNIKFNTQEIKAALSYNTINVGMAIATSRYFSGIYNYDTQGKPKKSQGSVYLEANWNPVLTEGLTLNLHAGHENIHSAKQYNFTDYKIGVTLDGKRFNLSGWSASLAWVYNNGNRSLWTFANSDGSSKVAVGSRMLATIAYSF